MSMYKITWRKGQYVYVWDAVAGKFDPNPGRGTGYADSVLALTALREVRDLNRAFVTAQMSFANQADEALERNVAIQRVRTVRRVVNRIARRGF